MENKAKKRKGSSFEDALRSLPLAPLSVFKAFKTGACVAFKKGTDVITTATDPNVLDHFQSLIDMQGGEILEAIPGEKQQKGKKIGVLFAGGPAAGGHNVILGLCDMMTASGGQVIGIRSGLKGLLEGDLKPITQEDLARVRNLGGFDLLGSNRKKIKTKEQFDQAVKVISEHSLEGLVIIGGDDSNTTAAHLAQYLIPIGCTVVGVPKTIDGDLQVGPHLPISFGFDTATKIYAELVGNILQDAASSQKYWHFVKVMGRTASHVALEIALKTQATLTFISEEVKAKNMTLDDVVTQIADAVILRSQKGLNHGVIVIPEGLIEHIQELSALIQDLNLVLSSKQGLSLEEKREKIILELEAAASDLFKQLPESIQNSLLIDRDDHGNVQVSQIPTEELLITRVKAKLATQEPKRHLNTLSHFFGYEGRSGAPSRFDADYTYNLGLIAGALVLAEKTGYMAALSELDTGGKAIAIPLSALLHSEIREGKTSMVIKKTEVELDSPAFKYFSKNRQSWMEADVFLSPGPRQLWGPEAAVLPQTVVLNQAYTSSQYLFNGAQV